MERAVFYARVSTEQEKQLNSIELQIEENRKAIKDKGWTLVDEYIDRGISGTKVKGRDEYQRLYDDMNTNNFDIIVVKDQDRLMRNTLDWYNFVNHLVQTGKRLYMYLDGKFYTPDDALITGIKAIIAEDFSRNLSKKLKNFNKGRMEKARDGDTDIVLHGIWKAYGWAQKDGKVVLDPEQARVKRLAIDLTLQGKGSTEVAKILGDKGCTNTVGNPWTVQDIPRLVYDEKNVGTVILNKKQHDFEARKNIYTDPSEWIYLKNAIPPIVTEEEWERLEAIRAERTTVDRSRGRKLGKSQFFSGKIFCGCCGATYWRKTKKGKPDDEFWVCSTKQMKGRKTRAKDAVNGAKGEINPEGCDNGNISTGALMDILQIAANMISLDTDKLKEGAVEWLTSLKKQLLERGCNYTQADLKKELQRKERLLDAMLDGIISKADYVSKLEALEEKISVIKSDLQKNEDKQDDVKEIDKLLANMDQTIAEYLDENNNLSVEFILEKLERVVIYPDEIMIKLPSFSKEIVVEKIQYVPDSNANFKLHDRAIYHAAVFAT